MGLFLSWVGLPLTVHRREGPLELCSLCLAKNCAKGRSKEALQINRDLDNIKAQIIKHYQHLSDREAFVTAEMVRNSYQGFGSEYETLLNAFDKDIASLKKRRFNLFLSSHRFLFFFAKVGNFIDFSK